MARGANPKERGQSQRGTKRVPSCPGLLGQPRSLRSTPLDTRKCSMNRKAGILPRGKKHSKATSVGEARGSWNLARRRVRDSLAQQDGLEQRRALRSIAGHAGVCKGARPSCKEDGRTWNYAIPVPILYVINTIWIEGPVRSSAYVGRPGAKESLV